MTTVATEYAPFIQPSQGIEVDWGEWKIGEDSNVLYTRGIGPCIGVAIYDRFRRIGHMAHIYPTESSQDEIIEPLMNSVKGHSPDFSNLTGWVTGGSLPERIPQWYIEGVELRNRVLQQLERLNLSRDNIQTAWNDNDDCSILAMSLDCKSGTCQINSYTPDF